MKLLIKKRNHDMRGIKETQKFKLGDAPVGIPPFFNNYRPVLVEPKFLLLHMICAIVAMSFYFVFLAVLTNIPRSKNFK